MSYSTIDIGNSASSRSGYANTADRTILDYANTANATGILTSFEVYFYTGTSVTGVKLGTFSGSGTSWTKRDYESIGSVTAGSKQTFTGKNCDVQTNDVIGMYFTTGKIYRDSSGGTGAGYCDSDMFDSSSHTYTALSGYAYSFYGTGLTVPDAPTSVSATDDLTTKVTVTWTAGSGETGGHRVYRDGSEISGVVAHGTSTYDDATATAGTTYSYTVKAINDAGLSSASTADNGTRASSGTTSFIQSIMGCRFIPSFIGAN